MSRLTVIVIVAFCVLGFNAKAEVFYWKKGYLEEGLYGNPENWEAETQENANARIPSETDEIFGAQHADWNFDGQTYTIGTWNSLVDRSGKADWNAYTINLKNGVFKVLNRRSRRDVINVMDGATLIFPEGSEYVASLSDGAIEYLYVKKGGRVEILGDFSPYKIHLYTEKGGTAVINPQSFRIYAGSHQENKITIYGTNIFENGLSFSGGGDAASKLTMTLGWSGHLLASGKFTRNEKPGSFTFSVSGGGSKIETLGDLSFSGVDSCNVEANTEFIVNDGHTLDISNFTFYKNLLNANGKEIVCVKSGSGTLAVGSDLPPKFRITAGTVAVKAVRSDLSGLVFPEGGVTVRYDVPGCRLDATEDPEQISSLKFESGVDLSSLSVGAVLFSSSDDGLLDRMKAEFEKSIPDGLVVGKSGDTLVLQKEDDRRFDTSKSSSLSDAGAWTDGKVPNGADVLVTGGGIAYYSLSSPEFASIMVAEGSTLVLQGGTESSPLIPPPLRMAYSGKIVCEAGSYVKLTNEIVCVATDSLLPVFEIATNAVLYADVPDHEIKGVVFKNMQLNYFGTIKLPDGVNYSTPCITFGSASADETAFFGLHIDGGILDVRDSITDWKDDAWRGNATMIRIMCPEVGGTVKPHGDLIWRNFSKTPEIRTENINGKDEQVLSNSGYQIGVGNPQGIRFSVLVSGKPMWLNGTSVFGGGADIVCTGSGSGLVRSEQLINYSLTQHVVVTNAAKITLRDGAKISYPYCCGGEKGTIFFNPVDYGHVSLELDGGIAEVYRTSVRGSRTAKVIVKNGCYDVGLLIPETVVRPEGGWKGAAYGDIFDKFAAIEIQDLLQVRAADAFPRPGWWNFDGCWDRDVRFADMPITGTGSILVTNITANNTMTLTMVNRGNQATGTIAAAPGTRSRLLFKDDANWAGTVIANGCVGLVNTDAATGVEKPAFVKFRNIHMDGEFPVRVWNTEAARTNDFIEISGFVTGSEGGFCGVPMDGRSPKAGDSYRFATYPASAELPVNAVPRWRLSSVPHEAKPSELVVLTLTYQPPGTTIVLR